MGNVMQRYFRCVTSPPVEVFAGGGTGRALFSKSALPDSSFPLFLRGVGACGLEGCVLLVAGLRQGAAALAGGFAQIGNGIGLVDDFPAEHLFKHVFEGYDASQPAVLVQHDEKMEPRFQKFQKQLVHRLVLKDETDGLP